MSKKTLYGSTQIRVVTRPDGVRIDGRVITADQARFFKSLHYTSDNELEKVAQTSDKYHWVLCSSESPAVRRAVASFSTEYHDLFKTDPDWTVRAIVAAESCKYHDLFKDDDAWQIRKHVAYASDKYHKQLKDDLHHLVRLEVAKKSEKYQEYLKDDQREYVRAAVASFSDKWHDSLYSDYSWNVRLAVAKKSTKYHRYLKSDQCWLIRLAVALASTEYHEYLKYDIDDRVRDAANKAVHVTYPTVNVRFSSEILYTPGFREGTWTADAPCRYGDVADGVSEFLEVYVRDFGLLDIKVFDYNKERTAGRWSCPVQEFS